MIRKILILSLTISALPAHATDAYLSTLTERAHSFEQLGLPVVAREQYRLILRLYPKAPGIEKSLVALSKRDAASHVDNARRARDAGVLPLALRELDRALADTPHDGDIKNLRDEWKKEERLRAGLREHVSKDYLEGLALYQKGQNDRALECFLRVLNLDPQHKGAMGYVERIGQKMDVGSRD
jgi:tetratricopeptide (TPR) repeat protein